MTMAKIETIADGVTLYLGDCREVLPTVGKFDAVVTDPPYGVAMKRGDSKVRGTITGDKTPPDVRWMADYPAIIWGGNNFCDQLPRSTGWLVWFKHFPDEAKHSQAELAWTNCVRTIRHYTEAYHGFMRQRDGWFHETQKPPGLMDWCIRWTNPGTINQPTKIVLDPYMGSGTTGIAAVRLGRRFIGIEIEPKHFDVACERISEATKQPNMFREIEQRASEIQVKFDDIWREPFYKDAAE
jgi:DNA modification methylase